jgi:hypothetical protein
MKIFGICIQTVETILEQGHKKKNSNSPSKFFFTYVKILNFTLYYYYILLYKIIYFTYFTILQLQYS